MTTNPTSSHTVASQPTVTLSTEDGIELAALTLGEHGKVRADVATCARCSGTHMQLCFRKLDTPVGPVTHWAPCPTTSQPVLLIDGDRSKIGNPRNATTTTAIPPVADLPTPTLLDPDGQPDGPHAELRDLLGLECDPRDYRAIASAALDEIRGMLDKPTASLDDDKAPL